jgi:hypothetical protein
MEGAWLVEGIMRGRGEGAGVGAAACCAHVRARERNPLSVQGAVGA